jgi:hypothetical protein
MTQTTYERERGFPEIPDDPNDISRSKRWGLYVEGSLALFIATRDIGYTPEDGTPVSSALDSLCDRLDGARHVGKADADLALCEALFQYNHQLIGLEDHLGVRGKLASSSFDVSHDPDGMISLVYAGGAIATEAALQSPPTQ